MDTPLFFAGSNRLSVFLVADKIIGWGNPDAKYFFQMWRDLASHVIYYRNLMNLQETFLPDFLQEPIETPDNMSFRYDYIAEGDLPAGSWIQFTAGLTEEEKEPYLTKILYKYYSTEINNVTQKMIREEKIYLDPLEFLILLTNLGNSTGKENLEEEINALIDEEDAERRSFNREFYQAYFDYIEDRIRTDPEFISRFLQLSGAHILQHLYSTNKEVRNTLDQHMSIISSISSPIQHAFLVGLPDPINSNADKFIATMETYQMNFTRFFMNT